MAEGKRPGGLTALAVLNFVFGGFAAIGTLLGFGGLALIQKAAKEVEAHGGTVTKGPSYGLAVVALGLLAVSAFLLITSGVGYLKQKRVMGRTLGTVYALLSLASTVLNIVNGDGIGIGTIIFSVYPVLTLIMVNTTFKDDLVN
jgi:hypothetical protein